MKVLVTGANGFLGSQVIRTLVERGHQVRGLMRSGTDRDIIDDCVLGVGRADLRSSPDLQPLFDGIDVLVHLAAAVTGSPDQQFSSAVVGTEKLLQAMSRSKTSRLVLASSLSVYDWSKVGRTITEDDALEERWLERDGYAAAKIWQERVCRRFARSFDWSLAVLRPGFIWGKPSEFISGVGLEAGKRHYVVVGPLSRLPLTHVVNCARAFAEAAEYVGRGGSTTLNIIDNQGPSSWTFARSTLRGRGKTAIPLPYPIALSMVRAIEFGLKTLFGTGAKLPSLLVSRRFVARFKSVSGSTAKIETVLPGYVPEDFKTCLAWSANGAIGGSR